MKPAIYEMETVVKGMFILKDRGMDGAEIYETYKTFSDEFHKNNTERMQQAVEDNTLQAYSRMYVDSWMAHVQEKI